MCWQCTSLIRSDFVIINYTLLINLCEQDVTKVLTLLTLNFTTFVSQNCFCSFKYRLLFLAFLVKKNGMHPWIHLKLLVLIHFHKLWLPHLVGSVQSDPYIRLDYFYQSYNPWIIFNDDSCPHYFFNSNFYIRQIWREATLWSICRLCHSGSACTFTESDLRA